MKQNFRKKKLLLIFLQNKNFEKLCNKSKELFLQNTYFYRVKTDETTNINL